MSKAVFLLIILDFCDTTIRMDPRERIKSLDHPHIRVLAGPGTGKTTAMMGRVARLLNQGIDPRAIFVVTFTRTAARDLISKLAELQLTGAENINTSTLHSFCFSVLSREEILHLTGRVPRPLLKFEEKYLIYDLIGNFGGVREREKRLRAFEAAWARLQSDEPGWAPTNVDRNFECELRRWLISHRAILLGELVPITLDYVRNNPECSERSRFEHVMVDEYQDLNKADQVLIGLLHEHSNTLVVGDDNQSIYRFRHAHRDGILNHPFGSEVITIQESKRLPKKIVEIANVLFPARPLQLADENPEGKIFHLQWQDIAEEASGIAKIIDYAIKNNRAAPGKILILAPNRDIGYPIRDEIEKLGIAVRSYFQEDALNKESAQEKWTLLSLLANRLDRVSLRVWLGFGSASRRYGEYQRVWAATEANGEEIFTTFEKLDDGSMRIPRTADILNRFRELKKQTASYSGLGIADAVERLFPEDEEELSDLRKIAVEVLPAVSDIRQLQQEMRERITQPELPSECDFIRVMSLHKSKGLTADLVIVAGCVDAYLPKVDIRLPPDEQQALLEEQKRLFYVAVTRSRNYLFLSSFLKMPSQRANRMGAHFRYVGRVTGGTVASRFITDLGANAPKTFRGSEFLKKLSIV